MSKRDSQATIVRAPKDRKNPYKMVRQATFEDNRLTWEARGVLAYLLVKPDDWEITVTDLWKSGDVGRDKVYKILAHLEEVGYIEREEVRIQGKFVGVRYLLHEEPLPENQVTVDALPNPENQETATRVAPFPETPYPVDQEHTNNEENTKDEIETKDETEVAADAAPPLPQWSEFLEAFCWICHGHKELSALTEKQRGILTNEAKRVRNDGFGIDDLRVWFRSVWQKDWRWTKNDKHERPCPADVRSMIPALRDIEPPASYQVDLPGVHAFVPIPSPIPELPPPPPPLAHDDPWTIALAEFKATLAGELYAILIGSRIEPTTSVHNERGILTPRYLVLIDPTKAASGLTHFTTQAGPAIRRKLSSLLGKPVLIEIVAAEPEPTT